MMNNYKKFLINCINNRLTLEYSEREMAGYLDNVSEKDYIDFEAGKYSMSDNNLKKIIRILAVNSIELFDVNDYIDTDGLSEEEIDDLSKVISTIVGDDDA